MKSSNSTVHFLGENCRLDFGRYGNGRVAINLLAPDGERVCTATSNLADQALGDGEVFIKDYSENRGVLDALVRAGVVEPTGRRVESGYASFPVARLLIRP